MDGNQMAAGRKTGGRTKGTPNKRTQARRLAEAEAMCALPEQFQDNSLALLQVVYRNTKLDLRTRIDAAKAALPYEVPRVEPQQTPSDVVPLHERIRAYAREAAIQASEKVVEKTPSVDERRRVLDAARQ
jgi:hypothetical protein